MNTYLKKYKIKYLEILIIFFVLQKIISSILGSFAGEIVSVFDEAFYLLIFIFTAYNYKDKLSRNFTLVFVIIIIIGVISVLFNEDISYSLFACFLGLLFYLNIYNIVVFRNFNFLESKLLLNFFSFITLLILFAIIAQIISLDLFFKSREIIGLMYNDNIIAGIIPFPTIFYGLWESAMVGLFLFFYWIYHYKTQNKKKYLIFILISFFTVILSFRLTEVVVLFLSIFYIMNKKIKIITIILITVLFTNYYQNLNSVQKEAFNILFIEKFIGYVNPDKDNLPIRNQLYYSSFEVLLDRFPIGLGPGNFSNNASQIFLKNTVKNHSFLKFSGIPVYNSNILGDSGYSMIIGEFGFFGFITYAIFMITIFTKIFFKEKKLNKYHILFLKLIFLYFVLGMAKGNYHFYTLFSVLFISQFAYLYRNKTN